MIVQLWTYRLQLGSSPREAFLCTFGVEGENPHPRNRTSGMRIQTAQKVAFLLPVLPC